MIVKTNEVVGNNQIDYSLIKNGYHLDPTSGKPVPFSSVRCGSLQKIMVKGRFFNLSYNHNSPINVLFMYSYFDSNNVLIRRVAGLQSGVTIDLGTDFQNRYIYIAFFTNDTVPNLKSYLSNVQLTFTYSSMPYEPFKGYKSYLTADSDKLMEEMN